MLPDPYHSSRSTPRPPASSLNNHSSSSTSFSPSSYAFSPKVTLYNYASIVTHPVPCANASIHAFCNRQPTLEVNWKVLFSLRPHTTHHTPHTTLLLTSHLVLPLISTILRFRFDLFCFCQSTLLVRWSHLVLSSSGSIVPGAVHVVHELAPSPPSSRSLFPCHLSIGDFGSFLPVCNQIVIQKYRQ